MKKLKLQAYMKVKGVREDPGAIVPFDAISKKDRDHYIKHGLLEIVEVEVHEPENRNTKKDYPKAKGRYIPSNSV